MFDPDNPHRRYNPLSGEWLLVSPERTRRPWQGQSEGGAPGGRVAYDAECYLCPGNRRAGNKVNPQYTGTFVFDNDFPALSAEPVPMPVAREMARDPLLLAEPTSGACRVICYSPRHDLTLAEMDSTAIAAVIDTWADQTAALGERWRWVQLFENNGAMMGSSNAHPHCQIWATSSLPSEAAAEDRNQRAYRDAHRSPLLVDYLERERDLSVRLVCENDSFSVVVPFWAAWPFETLIIPRRAVSRLPDLSAAERGSLAQLLRALLGGYDRLFDVAFPYSLGWHGAPFDAGPHDHWQLHAHIFPPLLRSATVRKFMVGYEMFAEPQRDFTPEEAAARLRPLCVKPAS